MSTTPPSAGGPGVEVAVPDYVDYIYDPVVDGNITADQRIRREQDWTTIRGEPTTRGDEVVEITRMEMVPPRNPDSTLQTFDALRLWNNDTGEPYPNIRYREFMLGLFGPDFHLSTPPLATPVLDPAGGLNPGHRFDDGQGVGDPVGSATPKFGTSTFFGPQLNNDGTAISEPFTIRLHLWRWRGTDREFQDYISHLYGRTTFNQHIVMRNQQTGDQRTYTREKGAVRLNTKDQWTRLTGGVGQEFPQVTPWATWADNNEASRPNTEYVFDVATDGVDVGWKNLEFDLTAENRAVFFDFVQVNEVTNLLEGIQHLDSRDENPVVRLVPDASHQLPHMNPVDGSGLSRAWARFSQSDVAQANGGRQVPVPTSEVFGKRQVVWSDTGGFRVLDDGTAIPADTILVGVQGKRLRLRSGT